MRNKSELGIYIHIPFCVHKCIYCDFLSSPADEYTRKKYVEALINEIYLTSEIKQKNKVYKEKQEDIVTSIFIGGGTPSVIDAGDIRNIIKALRENYHIANEAEITIECNPGTMDKEKADIYYEAGINRISFGLQSTNNNELKMLGRIHTYEQFLESYNIARKAGFDNINIDIMSALPGQTLDSFTEVLKTALSLKTEHISVYSLILEEGTGLADNIDKYPAVPSDDEDRRMYYMTRQMLSLYGYEQYEISNYAKKGYESRHNLKYWERCNYLGFGIGAASLYGNMRYTNTSDINRYINLLTNKDKSKINTSETEKKALENGLITLPREDEEFLSKEDEMSEYMFLGLRKTKGIDILDFRKEFGCDIEEIFARSIDKNIKKGLLVREENRLYLSSRGIDISNTVMSDFIITDC